MKRAALAFVYWLCAASAFAQVEADNAHLWASVRISNGGMGSGTIISPDGFGVTCGHLFKGTIGGKFKVAFADGGECEGTLLYHRLGNDQDIALFSIPKGEVRAYCPVAENPPAGDVRAVGYPGGQGPTLVQSSYVGHHPGRDKWQFAQYINNGQSGGGIFQGNYLVGVMVEKNRGGQGQPGDICTAVPLPTIVRALEAQCGPGGCSPGGAMGRIFTPTPNTPMGHPPMRGGSGGGQIPPAAPRDDLPGPAEDPIVPIPSKPIAGPPGPKGDKGDPGKDADEARIAKIEALLIELAQRKAEKGDKGERGEQGPKGDAADLSKLPPIKVEILGEHGEITYRTEVYLGGKPLQLQLVPRDPSSLVP